jgi:hypothetical protein
MRIMSELSPSSASLHRDLRWSQEARLRAIDAAAFWEQRVNRADLMRRFGISVPQATTDLREYQARAPGNLRYDLRAKAYVTQPEFQPLFGSPSAEAWLAAGGSEAHTDLPIGVTPLPARSIDPWLLRRVLAARRAGLALQALYQPMDQPNASWRWISPAALGSDGIRWHLRALNHDAYRYEDLLFPRILKLDGERLAGPLPVDEDWERLIEVRFRPAQRLSPGQQAVIKADYDMHDGETVLHVRAALLFLSLRRLGLDRGDGLVELANRDVVHQELDRINGRFTNAPER